MGATPLSRRDLLRAAGAAGLLFLPAPLWRAQALAAAPRRADRILILNLNGGVRSSAAFHASGNALYNPWGLLDGTGELRLGKLLGDAIDDARVAPRGEAESPLGDDAYTLGPDWQGLRLPRLAEAAASFSVLGTWNESRGDHTTSQQEETSGGDRGDAGILTRVHMALARQAGELDVPPFEIDTGGDLLFGNAPGASVSYASVRLASSRILPGTSRLPAAILRRVGERWSGSAAMFERIDRGAVAGLLGSNRLLAESHAGLRRNLLRLAARLQEPWIDLDDGDSGFGRVALADGAGLLTNAMLREVFLRSLGPDPDDPARARPLPEELALAGELGQEALNLSLAVRLLQLGAPIVVAQAKGFDLHADERGSGPALYRAFGRSWASLAWLLGRLEDPLDPRRRMLERTLVVTMSDFGRDPGDNQGFNDGEGSDHGAFPSCYYLAHAIMGAGIAPGRVIAGVATDGAAAYDARRADQRFGTQRFLATLLDALGLDSTSSEWGFPDSGGPIAQLWEDA